VLKQTAEAAAYFYLCDLLFSAYAQRLGRCVSLSVHKKRTFIGL
jgi:DNA-binding MurR/RpiR family transcriptional regulator